MSSKTIRVALVGVGGVCAQVHYPGFSRIPGVEIVGSVTQMLHCESNVAGSGEYKLALKMLMTCSGK